MKVLLPFIRKQSLAVCLIKSRRMGKADRMSEKQLPVRKRLLFSQFIHAALWGLCLLIIAGSAYAQEASKNVLLLNSYHMGFLWTDEITRGVQEAMKASQAELHIDYMDTKRQFGAVYQDLLTRVLRLKHARHNYNTVIVSDDNAFNFVCEDRGEIFGATPIIFCGVNYLQKDRLAGIQNITGVNEQADIAANFTLIRELHPDCGKVVVITDNTTTGRRIQEEVRRFRKARAHEIFNLELVYDVSVDELVAHLDNLDKGTIVLFTLFFRDKNDEFLEYDEGAELVSRHARVPVYCVWDFSFGFGMVGGYLTSGFDQGYEAGQKVLAVLNGADPASIPVDFESPTQLQLDYRQLKRHGISLAKIPPRAEILNKPVSFYDENKKLIWSAVAAFGLLLMALFGVSFGLIRSRHAERSIKDFKKAMDASSDAIGMFTPAGRSFYQNKTFDDMFGDIEDDPPARLFVNERLGREIFETMTAGKEWTGEAVMYGKDNQARDIFLRAYPVEREGQVVALVCVHTDITERKKSQAELQKMDKLKSIGTLAGGVAHDFNNILTGLFGSITIARLHLEKGHPAYKSLREAEKSMNRASSLANQLLTFSKGGDPVKEDAKLDRFVEEIVLFDLSGSNVKPVFSFADALWLAHVDKGQMQQVFSNLTINANQAMPNGGHVYITMENAEVEHTDARKLEPGKYIRVTLRDEGIGIDQKHQKRIFDPYYTTKKAGNGLGLATVYSIIEKHGGHISVDSEPGRGTTFTLYLPASEEAVSLATAGGETKEFASIQTGKILVMDDEAAIRQVAADMLGAIGYAVETAPEGSAALEKYKQAMSAGKPFDAVIMDLTVPGGMGGAEAIKLLLTVDGQASAIVSSGYSGDPVLAHYKDYGFKGIITKPYSIEKLQQVIDQVLQ